MEVLLIKALMFGGAFNPPTIAHIQLAEYAKKMTKSDVVIFVPTKMTYIKNDQQKDFAFNDKVRYEMLQKIASTRDWMLVSDFEIKAETQPRTYMTLLHLKEEGYACKLLFGSDKLKELKTGWKYMKEITEQFGIVCMKRSNNDFQSIIDNNPYVKSISPYIDMIDTPDDFQMISSSIVRHLFNEEKYAEIDQLIPEELNGLRNYTKDDTL